MSYRVATTSLNASTTDILNVIRQNAPLSYQQQIPVVTKETDIPKVGEVLYGDVALKNIFVNALVNRIGAVIIRSATFNSPYSRLKKGFLEFGESIEEIFVNIAKVYNYSQDKAEQRELKRYLPDIKSAHHAINWRVMYPITINNNALKQAFLSYSGVEELITDIVNQVYQAAEYDEFLLFKYVIIKAYTSGKIATKAFNATDIKSGAVILRSISNQLLFKSTNFNEAGVANSTPRPRQVIFMDADFNARFDVEVLAAAFNMDKTTYIGSLYLIDNFTTFDNKRFAEIMVDSDGLDAVTDAELTTMANVKAITFDEDWFMFYDNLTEFSEKYVASGLYWNYFYHVWKTISHSPFANAVAFIDSQVPTLPSTINVEVTDKVIAPEATVFTLMPDFDTVNGTPSNVLFAQNESATKNLIAVQPYGAIIIPASATAASVTMTATLNGVGYTAQSPLTSAAAVGDVIVFNRDE